jgi:DNA-binding MarR family transcriptional regulator/catechol 2,3-dioxygenase-like lactoylglutathione lyase family enzyme
MRAARGVYAQAIRAELDAIGMQDMPRNGLALLASVESERDQSELPAWLGVTKQAVSQLVDLLVTRGYVERQRDEEDRRRLALELTDRGSEALVAAALRIEAIDRQLARRTSPEAVETMRAGLAVLVDLKLENLGSGAGKRRRRGQLRSFSPIFPVADLAAALKHYSRLGFKTSAYEDGDFYGFAERDRVSLHLAKRDAHALEPPGAAYLYVRDSEALYEEWTAAGAGGETLPPGPTDYGMREGRHTDPDGNLIRFGSAVEDSPPESDRR